MLEIEPKYWDDEKNKVRGIYPLSIKLQNTIDEVEYKAKNIFYKFVRDEQAITFQNFEKEFKNSKSEKQNTDFYALANEYIENNKYNLSVGRYNIYQGEFNKLKRFRPYVNTYEIDYNFYKDYEKFLYEDCKNQTNTVGKSIKALRALENGLVRAGKMKKLNSDNYKIKSTPSSRKFLTLDELNALDVHYTKASNEVLKNTLKQFLFCCYTGIRFQSLLILRYCDIENNSIIINEPEKVKNNEIISVPLTDHAKRFLPEDINFENNAGDQRLLFNVISNQKSNLYLKSIADIVGINKNVHFHMARHTFATISLNLGIPIEVVQRLLGHRNIKTTLIYAKIVEKTKFEQMNKWNTV